MAKTGIQNYVNTVIFCVVMKIITIILLGLMVMGFVNDKILYFLITLEIGIVVIVIAALANISAYEKRIQKETKNVAQAKMTILSCPDYFTQTANNMCQNTYTTPDGRYTYTLKDASNLALNDYLNKPTSESCDKFTAAATSLTNGNLSYKFPWTDMASKCDVL